MADPTDSPPPAPPSKTPKLRKPGPRKPAGTAERGKAVPSRPVRPGSPAAAFAAWPLRQTAIVAAATFALDQLTKLIVVHGLDLAERREIDVINPFLNFRMAWNQGVNFGLFSSSVEVMRWLLIAVALAVCAWVTVWVRRAQPGRFARIAAGLLIGGALGNVVDRLVYGAVADFLNMSLPGWTNPYSFNIADIAIFAGALGLVFQPQAAKPRDGAAKPR